MYCFIENFFVHLVHIPQDIADSTVTIIDSYFGRVNICLKPNDEAFIGGGLFADMFCDATSRIREYLSNNTEEFERIISDEAFKKNFTVKGTKLKNIPKQYDAESAVADYLKYKSWYLEYLITDTEIQNSKNLIELFIEKFQLMKDFNDYLNKALIGFSMPNMK